jgi:hypothetical protein
MENAINLANDIEKFVNSFNCKNKILVGQLVKMHKTLKQSFMREIIMEFIKAEAENYKKGYYDDRNKATAEFCNKIMELAEKENTHFPFI